MYVAVNEPAKDFLKHKFEQAGFVIRHTVHMFQTDSRSYRYMYRINYSIKTRTLWCPQKASQCQNFKVDLIVQCSMGIEHTFVNVLAYSRSSSERNIQSVQIEPINFCLAAVKELSATWWAEMGECLSDNLQLMVNGFRQGGIWKALQYRWWARGRRFRRR